MHPTQFYKCLSDDTRLRCLLLIARETELCVGELVVALKEIQPKISRHLAQLRQCGLLIDRRQGQWVFYRIHPQLPSWCHQVLHETLNENEVFITQELGRLCAMPDRPVRPGACC